MAIEYGVFIVDGLTVKQQTLSLAGETVGLTNAEGLTGVSPIGASLVFALERIGPSGWELVGSYPDNINQTQVLIFSRQA